MKSKAIDELTGFPAGRRSSLGERAYLGLWFALSRRPWRSVVLVPGHPGGSAEEAARVLAEVGQMVSGQAVRAVSMGSLDYGTALALSDLLEQLRRVAGDAGQASRAIEVSAEEIGPIDQVAAPASPAPTAELVSVPSVARFIISVPCVLTEPLGLAATQGADLVVIMVEKGRTRAPDVRRIMEQVGRERIAGCFLVG